ncbi:MAG TPA: ABC-ATPase domain-containing protein [Longimicrobiales bacterium]|nr:ABC-ATPase domain-containing protein [Longimicrobiales bacterium]
MPLLSALADTLRGLDGRGYKSYKAIAGRYDAGAFELLIDHVQGDPFAEASRLRALVPPASAQLPGSAITNSARIAATADFLNRALHEALHAAGSRRGSGRSGELSVLRPGQEVLVRTSITVSSDGAVEARFRAGLPANGRSIRGHDAAEMLTRDVVTAVRAALFFPALDAAALRRHVETVEDARALRDQLDDHGLVAFVADDARLPRRTGIDDRPLEGDVIPFTAPDSLRVTLHAPNTGAITGLGIPRGVTLIVGGGFHGKSTLLRAIERGVYDHIPGDGRERVVTAATAVKARAEDGRAVAGTDIANFIGRIPGGADTRAFDTRNASGSTSQAAAIVEAIEVGARVLLLDEDTSATNFMIRDARMQALIADEHEPITPFIDRARHLADVQNISTIVVVGGSGDYFDIADTVIAMRDFRPAEVTAEAKRIAEQQPTRRHAEGGTWRPIRVRSPDPASIDPRRGHREVDVKARTEQRVMFGEQEVELSAVEQLVEPAQARAIALALAHARSRWTAATTLHDALRDIMSIAAHDGLDAFQEHLTGDLAEFRIFELTAFLNRIRGFSTR